MVPLLTHFMFVLPFFFKAVVGIIFWQQRGCLVHSHSIFSRQSLLRLWGVKGISYTPSSRSYSGVRVPHFLEGFWKGKVTSLQGEGYKSDALPTPPIPFLGFGEEIFLKCSPWVKHCIRYQEDFPESSVGKEFTSNAGDPGSIPGLGRSPGEGIGYPLQYSWTSLVAQLVKNPPTVWETRVRSLGWEKGKATHSSILAWRILWTVRVRHNWVTFTLGTKNNFALKKHMI